MLLASGHRNRCRPVLVLSVTLAALLSACSEPPAPPLKVPDFNASRAFSLLERQVAFGPRVPGTASHAACLDWLDSTLAVYADQVVRQSFDHTIMKTGESVRLTNLIASFGASKGQRILLAAHWDTRPWADSDPDTANHRKPVPGGNDGGSGVAVLLEIARILKEDPPDVGVDIILFDGEDAGTHGVDESWASGARYFAKNKGVRYSPHLGILLDMIGDRDLKIRKEGHSVQYAPGVTEFVWNYAKRLGLDVFSDEVMGPVTDDHLPLIEAGIPCINLIDLDYPYHHTIADTPDKCSPESLEAVARVTLAVVYNPPK